MDKVLGFIYCITSILFWIPTILLINSKFLLHEKRKVDISLH